MNNHFMKQRSAAAGLILMSSQLEPTATYEFEAEILIMNHPSKIRVNYEPVIHVGSVRQTGKIMEIHKIMETTTNKIDQEIGEEGKDELSVSPSTSSTPMKEKSLEIPQVSPSNGNQQSDEVGNGDKAIIRFKFLYNPEFIMIGETIIIREDRTKGIGKITRLIR
jgi:GTPase